jgi:hypothetical protein
VQFGMNPITGSPIAVDAFRTNTLVFAFDFAY